MTRPTRRRVLAGAAVLAGSLAGCLGSTDGDPPEATIGAATGTPADSPPSCSSADADQLLTIRPRGVTVATDGREAAESVAADARDRVAAAGAVRVVDTAGGAAVEIDAGHSTTADAGDAFADRTGVRAVYRGRSLPTVRSMAERARTSLAESVDPESLSVTVVDGRPAHYLVVAVTGGGEDGLLDDADSLEFRVAAGDGERTLVGAGAIQAASGEAGTRPSVRFSLTEAGRERFARGLREVGALAAPRNASVRAYFRGERIFDGPLRPDLARAVRSGEWEGEFALQVATAEEMRDVEAAMNVVSFDVGARTSFERCE